MSNKARKPMKPETVAKLLSILPRMGPLTMTVQAVPGEMRIVGIIAGTEIGVCRVVDPAHLTMLAQQCAVALGVEAATVETGDDSEIEAALADVEGDDEAGASDGSED